MSSSSGVNSSYSSNGLSGLVSGLDTESMVKKLLQGTQTKIDKQKQQKQLLEWKQTMYRSIISKINTFRSTYFDTTYGSTLAKNLSSSSFFGSMVSNITSGSSVKVASTSSSASGGTTSVTVSQLASAAKLSSNVKMSGSQVITGKEMNVDSIKSTLESGTSITFDLSLDGVSKTISFSAEDFTGEITADSIKTALDSKVKSAFGTYVGVSMTDNKLSFSINIKDSNGNLEAGHELLITGSSASYFGITPGASSLLSMSTRLGDIAGITGGAYEFAINGVNFSFSADTTVSAMMREINASKAGVKMTYSTTTDTFKLEATSTGAQYGIEINQTGGNLLSVLFGSDTISAGSKALSTNLNAASIQGTALADDYTTTTAAMTFKVNGTSYTFALSPKEEAYTKSEIESALNSWLSSTFGENGGVQNIRYEDGVLHTAAGFAVSFEKTTVNTNDPSVVEAAAKRDLALALGFSIDGASNAVTGETPLADIAGLSGAALLDADGNCAATLADIAFVTIDGVDYEAAFTNGRLSISGSGTVDLTGTGLSAVFGSDTLILGDGQVASGAIVQGSDLKVTINGVETSRSSNTFTVDGMTLTATHVSEEPTIIETTRDVDKVVSAISSFISDYNALIKELNGYLSEKAEYRDYPPLTDAQKAEMSDKEIENWTAKAKTGLLRNDTYISSFLQRLRSAFYTTVPSAGIAAYSIGIETSSNNYIGELTLDEAALRSAIATDPDAVSKLFTDAQSGLSKLVMEACDGAAKTSVASPGSLVQLAGADGWSANATSNDMYYQLKRINDKLAALNTKYEAERVRYWNRFSAMESIIAQYSSQSAMLTSTFFSNGQ